MADTNAKKMRKLIFGTLDTKYKAIKSQLQEPSDSEIAAVFGNLLGSSSLPLAMTVAGSLSNLYTSCALTAGNMSAMTIKMIQTGASATITHEVGQFILESNVKLGNWANAIIGKIDLKTAGHVTGLAGAVCAELDMPGGAVSGGAGTYACFEAELNMPASYGGGVPVSIMVMNVWGDEKAKFDTDGYIFDITGLTGASGKVFQPNTAGAATHALRIRINGTPYYLMLTDTGA